MSAIKIITLKGETADTGQVGDYLGLENKPSINGVQLIGNKTNEELNIDDMNKITNSEIEAMMSA